MNSVPSKEFDWLGEVSKSVTYSLATTFGLDFLLLEDKKGGDVDTVHNVRKGIWATDTEKERYESQEKYGKKVKQLYDRDDTHKNRRKRDTVLYEEGNLLDKYSGKILNPNSKITFQLDHIIPTSEIHRDQGRVLAEIKGVDLANTDSNYQSTYWAINKAKNGHKIEDFVNIELPKYIEKNNKQLVKLQNELRNMPSDTPQQRHEKREQESKITKKLDYINALESIDKEAMLESDRIARREYNSKVYVTYYTSSKFFKASAISAVSQGMAMGARQAVGLILAEIWFELKEAIPSIYNNHKNNFNFDSFWNDVEHTFSDVLIRVKNRFKDIVTTFKDSLIGGILASISTTLLNIVFTSSKLVGKLIRESWDNLVRAMKLVFFNPQKLAFGDLMREVTRIILASVSTIIGVAINQHLATFLTIPFGTEIAAFVSALFIGLFTVGTGYFLDHSPTMKKIWDFLNSLKDKYEVTLDFMKEANAEIDQYVTELARVEFNLNPNELQVLADNLTLASSEIEKASILREEIKSRDIDLPYEIGNSESTKKWLKAKFNSKK